MSGREGADVAITGPGTPAEELPQPPSDAVVDALRRSIPRARRALHHGRGTAILFVAIAGGIVLSLEPLTAVAGERIVMFAASWLLAVHAVNHALSRVRIVAGSMGVAVFAAAGGFAVASGLSLWLQTDTHRLRLELIIMALLALLGLYAAEVSRARVPELRKRVILVGTGEGTRDALDVLSRDGDRFVVVGVVAEEHAGPAIEGATLIGQLDDLGSIIEREEPDLVVIAVDRGRPDVFAQLASVARLGFKVVGIPEFYEHAFGRVPIRSMTNAWFMSVLHLYQRPYAPAVKRGFDLVVAGIGLIVTLPLFGLVALFVAQSGRPIFYRQVRLGEHGRHFTILKFRTMRPDAESAGAVWAADRDPRTTRIGGVLRRTRLDELPQLLNVLRGDMAIVGPRPERPEFVALLEAAVPFWSRRHLLKPGVTGWAQIRADYASDALGTEEKLAYDLWYLRHRSLVVDSLICVRTLASLFLVRGR
jgi:exopolysaccharide biosynthesis polyprenyl glycosylphosphotransferase